MQTLTDTTIIDRNTVIGTLLQLIRTELHLDAKTRDALVAAMGCMGPEAAPTLVQALSDRDAIVRQCAGSALRIIARRTTEILPAVKEALCHPDENVRLAAAIALLQSPRPNTPPARQSW